MVISIINNRSHILQALEEINSEGVPLERKARKFYLLYEGKCYPPKYVIFIANKFANGRVLLMDEINGGKPTNDFLTIRGFNVIGKTREYI